MIRHKNSHVAIAVITRSNRTTPLAAIAQFTRSDRNKQVNGSNYPKLDLLSFGIP